jgi:hypothetical protein
MNFDHGAFSGDFYNLNGCLPLRTELKITNINMK